MKLDVNYNPEWNQYTIFWPHDQDEHNKEIRRWCNQSFGADWEDGIDDLDYVRLDEKKAHWFIMRWGG